MKTLKNLLESNQNWAASKLDADPDFFSNLAKQQTPEYLWIGCADSRVPSTQITGLQPGEVFVHRNIANVVVHSDLNCLSVIQYAVEVLKVKHIIVCGHYGCGGVMAALGSERYGLIDNWLRHIKDVINLHEAKFTGETTKEQVDLLCELNVREQVKNVCQTPTVQTAWANGSDLTVHGWIYGLEDGILNDLECTQAPSL